MEYFRGEIRTNVADVGPDKLNTICNTCPISKRNFPVKYKTVLKLAPMTC